MEVLPEVLNIAMINAGRDIPRSDVYFKEDDARLMRSYASLLNVMMYFSGQTLMGSEFLSELERFDFEVKIGTAAAKVVTPKRPLPILRERYLDLKYIQRVNSAITSDSSITGGDDYTIYDDRERLVQERARIGAVESRKLVKTGIEYEVAGVYVDTSSAESLIESIKASYEINSNKVQKIDSLSNIGVSVAVDALREISTAVGSAEVQSRFLEYLYKLGILEQDDNIGIHINASGFNDIKGHLQHFLAFDLIIQGTDLFGKLKPTNEIPLITFCGHSNKTLFDDGKGFQGFGIRIHGKGDDEYIEFRGVQKIWEGKNRFQRDLKIFSTLLEPLVDFTQEGNGDPFMAETWRLFERDMLSILSQEIARNDLLFHGSFTEAEFLDLIPELESQRRLFLERAKIDDPDSFEFNTDDYLESFINAQTAFVKYKNTMLDEDSLIRELVRDAHFLMKLRTDSSTAEIVRSKIDHPNIYNSKLLKESIINSAAEYYGNPEIYSEICGELSLIVHNTESLKRIKSRIQSSIREIRKGLRNRS